VKTLLVIKTEVFPEPSFRLYYRLVFVQKYLLIFHQAPRPLDEDVVKDPTAAVHADLDAVSFQESREVGACELRALIRIEDLRLRDLKRSLNSVQYRRKLS
jgi:hypothetical protein